MRMIISTLRSKLIPAVSFMIVLSAGCGRKQEPMPEIPSAPPAQTEAAPVPEPPETAPSYTGQPLLFIDKDDAVLYSKPSESSMVRIRLQRDALLVLITEGEEFIKVYTPITGGVGYVKAQDVTDSIRTSAEAQKCCSDLGIEAKAKLMREYERFPTIEALEKYYLYPFISTDDMIKMISIYKGDIGRYTFTGKPVAWELPMDTLPKAIVKKLRADSLTVSTDTSVSKVILLAGEPFLYSQNEYDDEGVIRKPSGEAVRTIKSRLFEESIRLIRFTRERGTGPIIVTHGPPHYPCHQCETPVSLFGAGSFIHTYEKRVPVKLLLKNGFSDAYITRIVHSTFEVSPCYLDGGKGLIYIETMVPEGEKIYGILLGLDDGAPPVVTIRKNGDWSADLNNDGINDLKCLFEKGPEGYEELLSAYYFVNKNGTWVLTDIRCEPACS